MRALLLLPTFFLAITANAQWQILDTHSTADLRGIANVGEGVAWASGSNGTVLRTEDGGLMWQTCVTPPGAEHLDFRGIQALDNNTAIVMSSGTGDLSRVYETTDGCQTWKLIFTNPDKDGFWDGLYFIPGSATILVLGDPVNGRFRLFSAQLDRHSGEIQNFSDAVSSSLPSAASGEGSFAASNSSFAYNSGDGTLSFIVGGGRSEILHEHSVGSKRTASPAWSRNPLPFASCESCGVFSIALGPTTSGPGTGVVAVGGDYKSPDSPSRTAAYSDDGGYIFQLSSSQPHGFRSAVAYDAAAKAWIAVGPNGTDISTDNGRNWRALRPGPGDAPDADRRWNALSLPFAVGPHGRIGMLSSESLLAAPNRK